MDKEEEKLNKEKKEQSEDTNAKCCRRWKGFFLIVLLLLLMVLAGGFLWLRYSIVGMKTNGSRINFLLLGAGSDSGAAKDLTDTLILFSLDTKGNDSLMISLPRDIWVSPLVAKINAVYHYAEEKDGQGLRAISSEVEAITGQSIQYAALVNFDVLKEVINFLGGVEVEVERSFDDYFYPIPGKENDMCDGDIKRSCRYEHLHFDAGHQLMNGETALKYVRSRQAEGEEGTDFARARRQQILLQAIKKKALSPDGFRALLKPLKFLEVINSGIERDIPDRALPGLAYYFFRVKDAPIRSCSLESFLYTPLSLKPYSGQWVLISKTGNWNEIKTAIGYWLLGEACQSATR